MRAIALMGAASAAVHQLRYAIGYGQAAPHALGTHGHGYLAIVMPIVMVLALLTMARALTGVARGRGSASARGSLLPLWLITSIALAGIYGIQETVEGSGAIAGGGWIGLALAIPAGLLVALALRGAAAAEVRPLALPRIRVIRGVALALAPASLRVRVATLRLRARGPPPASFVQ